MSDLDWFDWRVKPLVKPSGEKAVYVTHFPTNLTAWEYANPKYSEEYNSIVLRLREEIEIAIKQWREGKGRG